MPEICLAGRTIYSGACGSNGSMREWWTLTLCELEIKFPQRRKHILMLVLSGWHRRVLKMGSVEKLSQFKKLQIQVRGGNKASMEEVCHWGHAVKSTARPSSGSALCPIFEHFPQPHDSSVMLLPCLGSQGNGTAHHAMRTLKVSPEKSSLVLSGSL